MHHVYTLPLHRDIPVYIDYAQKHHVQHKLQTSQSQRQIYSTYIHTSSVQGCWCTFRGSHGSVYKRHLINRSWKSEYGENKLESLYNKSREHEDYKATLYVFVLLFYLWLHHGLLLCLVCYPETFSPTFTFRISIFLFCLS